jgi:hypothetical protein
MPARLGSADEDVYASPRPALLRAVTGLEPERGDAHVRLDRGAQKHSIQRLAIADVGGGAIALLWPAELKEQALHLYCGGHGPALLATVRRLGWSVDATPHLAFHNARPSMRLYLDPDVDVDDYVRRWAGRDADAVRAYEPDEVEPVLWPWLKERCYARDADDAVFLDYRRGLGRRKAHLRPGLRLARRWSLAEVSAAGEHELARAIRADVDALLLAAGDRALPTRLGR